VAYKKTFFIATVLNDVKKGFFAIIFTKSLHIRYEKVQQ